MFFIPLQILPIGSEPHKYVERLAQDLGKYSHSSSWLVSERETTQMRGLIAIVDGSQNIGSLPTDVSQPDVFSQELIILDIAKRPRTRTWAGVYSYMWIPAKQPYTAVKNFFFMSCCNATDKALRARYYNWKWFIRGQYRIKVYKAPLYPNTLYQLGAWPVKTFPKGRYIVQVGANTRHLSPKDKFFPDLLDLTNRLPAPGLVTILNEEFSRKDAFIAILQLEPL